MITHGEWIGGYPNGEEVVEIYQYDRHIYAVKKTGSDYIPAGELTWGLDMDSMQCLGWCAEENGHNKRMIVAELKVIDRDRLRVTWGNDLGTVVFRRDGL